MIKGSNAILYYLKNPITPVYDYYIDANGNYKYLAAGTTHVWEAGETDSSGYVKTTSELTWFLPSLDELALMYTNLKSEGVGNFQDDDYWTSSEYSATQARKINFTAGTESFQLKSDSAFVRPIRKFTAPLREYALRDTGEAGGLIFYIDGTTYYESALAEQAEDVWSNVTASEIGTTGTAVGTGQANTTAIVGQAGQTASAALTCNNYTVNVTYTSLTIELEWKDQDKLKIASRILRTMGVVLSEAEVFQYAQQLKTEQ